MRAKSDDDKPIRPPPLHWLVPAALCVLLGIIFSTQQFVWAARSGEPVSWVGAFVDLMPYWLAWALLTPVIGWLSRLYRIEKGHRISSIVIHIVASIFLASIYPSFYILIFVFTAGPQLDSRTHFFFFINAHVFGAVIYWAILSIILTLNYYRRYQDEKLGAVRLEGQLKEAELQSLRMQLNPHFLFNALHSVTALILKNENRQAVHMINRLSELLRFAIADNDTQWVSLKQELEFLDRYLEIERIRFQDRLKILVHIEPRTLQAEVPNFILQPLVENAIRHAVSKDSAAGTITLTAIRRSENGNLYLEVRDDGPGLPAGWHNITNAGVGLKNIRARLEQLYGREFDFALRNGESRGVIAELTLPFRTIAGRPSPDKHED